MLDDLRNHDTEPNEQERAWMSLDPLALLMRLAVLAILAIAIGLSATQIAAPSTPDTVVTVQR
jgi:hypothetical protein